MHMAIRKKGSQRAMAPVKLKFEPNWAGQGGQPYITMLGDDGKYYLLHFDGIEEGRELLSQAHICWGNICDEEGRTEALKARGIERPKID